MTTAVILQSNYIPWRGYFDLIDRADHFIFFDTAQYTKNDWRNRNRIKTAAGTKWLTIPVAAKFGQTIQEAIIADPKWGERHWKSLVANYAKAPYFSTYSQELEEMYKDAQRHLCVVNYKFIFAICDWLGIRSEFHFDWQLCRQSPDKTQTLVDFCKKVGADRYLSGGRAATYIDPEKFRNAGIALEYIQYDYPEYPQLWSGFDPNVSILDLLFNTGPQAIRYIKGRG